MVQMMNRTSGTKRFISRYIPNEIGRVNYIFYDSEYLKKIYLLISVMLCKLVYAYSREYHYPSKYLAILNIQYNIENYILRLTLKKHLDT